MNKSMIKLTALSFLGLTAGSVFAVAEASAMPAAVPGIYVHQDDSSPLPVAPGPVVQGGDSNPGISTLPMPIGPGPAQQGGVSTLPLGPGPVVNPETHTLY